MTVERSGTTSLTVLASRSHLVVVGRTMVNSHHPARVMNYRAPLINPNTGEIDNEHGRLLTDAQWAKFAHWSWQQKKSVHELITEMNPILQQSHPDRHEVMVEGVLPHCGLFGGIDPSGSCHT